MKLHVLHSPKLAKLEIYSSGQQALERIQTLNRFSDCLIHHYALESLEEYYDLCDEIMGGVIDYAYWAIPELNLNFDRLDETQIEKIFFALEA
jgi:hypothetical protein